MASQLDYIAELSHTKQAVMLGISQLPPQFSIDCNKASLSLQQANIAPSGS
jgi:hypothetical protein